jgi:hypothetical protein
MKERMLLLSEKTGSILICVENILSSTFNRFAVVTFLQMVFPALHAGLFELIPLKIAI